MERQRQGEVFYGRPGRKIVKIDKTRPRVFWLTATAQRRRNPRSDVGPTFPRKWLQINTRVFQKPSSSGSRVRKRAPACAASALENPRRMVEAAERPCPGSIARPARQQPMAHPLGQLVPHKTELHPSNPPPRKWDGGGFLRVIYSRHRAVVCVAARSSCGQVIPPLHH